MDAVSKRFVRARVCRQVGPGACAGFDFVAVVNRKSVCHRKHANS